MQRVTPLFYRTALAAFLLLSVMPPALNAQDQTVGLFHYDPATYPGYTLFAPMRSTTTYLIDNYGRLVHTWPSSYTPALSAYLLENGNLLRSAQLVIGGGGGSGGRVEEIAWDGTIVWEFEYYSPDEYLPHHDIEGLPNGNVLILAWEYKTEAEAFAAGRDPALLGFSLQPEHIVEVQPTGPASGEIVWRWHLWDHLVQDYDSTKDNYGVVAEHPELIDINFAKPLGKADWIHANSVDYNPDLDQIVISAHNQGEFWIIDHSTTIAEAAGHTGGNSGMGGDILYRWGNPQGYDAGVAEDQVFFNQHDASWVEPGCPGEGNILIFNNGLGRPSIVKYSSVDEVVTPVDGNGDYPQPPPGTPHGPAGLFWTYVADPPGDFYSANISSAQRLPNGNTLVCSGNGGWFFEVTSTGEIVWNYLSPVIAGGPVKQGIIPPETANNVFRCNRYPLDYPGLAGYDLTPGAPLEIYPISIAGTSHSPATPLKSDSVIVIATIVDDVGVALAELYADTGDGYFAIPMFDDGDHHDQGIGDAVYGAVIPPADAATAVSYYIHAVDDADTSVYDPPGAPVITYGYVVYQSPQIHINEFLTANVNCCSDEHGDYDDWVELYNAEPVEVNLAGMYLTNDPADPVKFQIGDTTIPAGGYLVFWADEEPGEGLTHVNFTLQSTAGTIGLFDTDEYGNQAIDSLDYGSQVDDISFGRHPDGGDDWQSFDPPTPGAANLTCACPDFCDLNLDESINPLDVIILINHVYKTFDSREVMPASCPNENGDWDCNGGVTPLDVTYYVNFVYKSNGTGPCDPCSP